MKYKVITSDKQYYNYCQILYDMDFSSTKKPKEVEDEIDLLTLLIETYDAQQWKIETPDPIQFLRSFMDDHKMKAKDLVELLDVSKGYVSDILNYKKGLSKDVIRKLADRFKVRQEAFNREYKLKGIKKLVVKRKSVIRKRKKVTNE